jgi:hypothetical protein
MFPPCTWVILFWCFSVESASEQRRSLAKRIEQVEQSLDHALSDLDPFFENSFTDVGELFANFLSYFLGDAFIFFVGHAGNLLLRVGLKSVCLGDSGSVRERDLEKPEWFLRALKRSQRREMFLFLQVSNDLGEAHSQVLACEQRHSDQGFDLLLAL